MTGTQPATSSHAKLVDKVPLIRSPSFWIPPPVELPNDIHPLPEDVTAYFVYPFTLETHVLATLPKALSSLQDTHTHRLNVLAHVAESRERAHRQKLNKIAPGWGQGDGAVMRPVVRAALAKSPPPPGAGAGSGEAAAASPPPPAAPLGRSSLEHSGAEGMHEQGDADRLSMLAFVDSLAAIQSPAATGPSARDKDEDTISDLLR